MQITSNGKFEGKMDFNSLNKLYTFGDLDVSGYNIKSLEQCPEVITGNFSCSVNQLTSLVDGPQQVYGHYFCYGNQLTDLVGCASHITGILDMKNNNITSLIGIHKIIKSCTSISLNTDKITEGGIGVLLINNLEKIGNYSNRRAFKIIEQYIGYGTKGMMECRKELTAKGYAVYAKL